MQGVRKKFLALQLPSALGNREENFASVERALGERTPDFLVLSEVWSVGWYPEIFKENASCDTLEFLKDLAKRRAINVIGGSYIREVEGKLYNSCPVINRKGEVLGHYDKNHLFPNDGETEVVTQGEKLFSFELEGINMGLSLCYDIRFPELFREYIKVENPPELLINMSAWPLGRKAHYRALCMARAIENQCYFLGLSQCGEIKNGVYNAGSSLLVDPFGEIVQELSEDEGEIFKTIDTARVKEIREKYPNLKARKERYIV